MRKLTTVLAILCILVAGLFLARKAYRSWAEERAMREARELIAQSDYAQAALRLRRALQVNADNVEAVRLMGDFAEMIQSPAAVFWRQRLAELEPATTNKLAWARAAIVHGEFEAAQQALKSVDESGRQTSAFYRAMGDFATSTGRLLEAENHFQQAVQLQPDNPTAQLNLAMIRVQRRDPQLAGQARQQLEGLAMNPVVRTDALRHLTLDALRRTNYTRALSMAEQLVAEPKSLFNDKLLQLDVLRAADPSTFQESLANLQQEVATNANAVFVLSRWMLHAADAAQTLNWLQRISQETRTSMPVTMVVADAYLGMTNWAGLQAWIADQNWGEMEHVRLAMSARALREQGQEAAAAEWSKAIATAGARLDRLVALQRLAQGWHWVPEQEQVLQQILQKYPGQKRSIRAFSDLLYLQGKTRELLAFYAREHTANPDDFMLKKNLAGLALLLEANEYAPHKLAQELYAQQPLNPGVASVYAYSLYVQKKPKEGLNVLEQLRPEQRNQPSVAGYYGLLLAETGNKAKAQPYFQLAGKARLLPEEEALFKKAAGSP